MHLYQATVTDCSSNLYTKSSLYHLSRLTSLYHRCIIISNSLHIYIARIAGIVRIVRIVRIARIALLALDGERTSATAKVGILGGVQLVHHAQLVDAHKVVHHLHLVKVQGLAGKGALHGFGVGIQLDASVHRRHAVELVFAEVRSIKHPRLLEKQSIRSVKKRRV